MSAPVEETRMGPGLRWGDECPGNVECRGDVERRGNLELQVRALLNDIVDPCSAAAGNPMGLVDMGLVRNLAVSEAEGGRVAVRADVRVTDPNCLMGVVFTAEVRKRLEALPEVASHDVRLSHEFDWTPDDVTGPGAVHMREVRRVVERRVSLERLRKAPGHVA